MYIYYNIYKYIKKNAVRSGGGSEGPPRPGLGRLRRRATRVSCLWLPLVACDTGELPLVACDTGELPLAAFSCL